MNFAEIAKNEANFTRTENGAVALRSTNDALLDLFATIGALRNPNGKNADAALTDQNKLRARTMFDEAYAENPLAAAKILFYARDIQEGLGERAIFRYLLNYAAKKYPSVVENNIKLIGSLYGRYDDLYCLIDTPLEGKMWEVMKAQFEQDLRDMAANKPVSLLAQWVKTADSASQATRELGILTAKKLGYTVYDYKRKYRSLRKYIGVTECLISTNQWDKVDYSEVPSRAMMIYRGAFKKHDEERFQSYLDSLARRDEGVKINASTLFPYDITEKFLGWDRPENPEVLEAQWEALPNYVEDINALVMADVSGSMTGRPMASSIGLALYFAERNTGAFHNLFMTFSRCPDFVQVRGNSLADKIKNAERADWGMNTNLHAAFKEVLDLAVKNKCSADEMPKSIIVISDMEIDQCGDRDWSFYDQMKAEYAAAGYEIPNVIFWNVNSRHDTFHADKNRKGVQLFSGQSVNTFKMLMQTVGMTPVEAMFKVINSERYAPITVKED